MNRRYIYPILILLVTIGLYYLEDYVGRDQKVVTGTSGSGSSDMSVDPDQSEFPKWIVPHSPQSEIVLHKYYSLSYDEQHEQARWVAYELRKNQVVNNNYDRPYFEQDPLVKTKSADWRNYKNSGYDRGHLVAAADMEFSYNAFKDTFFTSNVSPQLHEFNSGVWNYLEQRVRRWAKQNDGVYVITGPVLESPIDAIGSEQVRVPKALYKIIVDSYRDEYRVIAFLIPHEKDISRYSEYIVTIDEIEAATGIDFFSKAPKELEAELETRTDRLYFDID